MSKRLLPVVVIYQDPSDFPGKFVARRQWVTKGGTIEIEACPLAVVDSLDEARAVVPAQQSYRADRLPNDDPSILEIWI